MESNNRKIWILIQRYVVGTASESEKKSIEKWVSQSPENRRILEQVKHIWANTPEENFRVNVEAAWRVFKNKKMKRADEPEKVSFLKNHSRDLHYFLRVAAVLLISVALGLLIVVQLPMQQQKSTSEEVAMRNIQTEVGGKAELTFSDGSKVILNSASSLRFPEEFRSTVREVYLDGQAYFEVEHDPERPFIVYNKGVKVEVLGTQFDVRGWQEDKKVKVVVRSGKVSVEQAGGVKSQTEQTILTKGMVAEVEEESGIKTMEKVDVRQHLVWMSGGLYFENTPFRQVIKDIERRFEVDISVDDPRLLDISFTSTFYDADLDEVLQVLSASLKVDIRRNEDKITFQKP